MPACGANGFAFGIHCPCVTAAWTGGRLGEGLADGGYYWYAMLSQYGGALRILIFYRGERFTPHATLGRCSLLFVRRTS